MTSTTTSTWDALAKRLDSVEKPVGTLKLCPDPNVRDRYLQAKKEADHADGYLKELSKDADPDARALVEKQVSDAKAELIKAQKAYDEQTITLKFTALERKRLEALQDAHPAGEEDEARGDDFALDTFAPALIAAASLDGMPADYARQCLDTWPPSDARDLWNAAWSIQHRKRTDLGKG